MGVLKVKVGSDWVEIPSQGPQGPPGPPGSGGSTVPGGATTQVQFNDAGIFGGDAGLTFNKATDVVTAAGAVAVGAAPAQSGAIRLENGALIKARNPTNTLDFPVIALDGQGYVFLGTDLNFGQQSNGIISYVPFLQRNSVVISNSGTLTIGGNNPAQSGVIRLENNVYITARNAANTADVSVIGLDGSNAVLIGGTNVVVSAPLYARGNLILDQSANYISIGTAPAQSGTIRIGNVASITARNAANSADVKILGLANDNTLYVGEQSAGVRAWAPYLAVGQTMAVAQDGGIRLANAGGNRSGVICGRNAANNADADLVQIFSDNNVYVGAFANDAGLILRSASGNIGVNGQLIFNAGYNVRTNADSSVLNLASGSAVASANGAYIELRGASAAGGLNGSIHMRLGNQSQAEWRIYHGNGVETFKISANGRIQTNCWDNQYAYWNSGGGTGLYHEFAFQGSTYGYLGNDNGIRGGSAGDLSMRATGNLVLLSDTNAILAPPIYTRVQGSGGIGNVYVTSGGLMGRVGALTSRNASGAATLSDFAAVARLRPVMFTHDGQPGIGFLGDEVAAIDARLVTDLGDGEPMVNLGAVVAALTATVQRLLERSN